MRVDRLLSILLIISNKGMITGQELAEHFEVSLRTIYRDIDKICEAGVPIASNGGKGGGFYLMENYNLDNLFFNKGEAHTLMTVMNSLSVLFGRNKQFNDIVLKFENAYEKEKPQDDNLNISMSHFSMEDELKEYLFLMDKGIESSKLLVFDYINRNLEYIERIVEPIQIAFSHGQWYLNGFCRTRNDLRKFKLVRIRNLKLSDSFEKKIYPKDDLQRMFDESYDKKSLKVILKFSKRIGEQLPEYFHKNCIKSVDNNHFIVEDSFPYEEGFLKFILGFGKECEVIEPDYVREDIKKYIEEVLLKYN